MAPLSRRKALEFWQRVIESAQRGERTLLVLDTVAGADGERRLYTRLGWQRVGVIPGYALWPHGGTCDTTFLYKVIPAR
jgi:hypothetical protein